MTLTIPPILLKSVVVDAVNTGTYVAGGAVALGVLAWIYHHWRLAFLVLFTRLVRPRILDQHVRAKIHQLVEAEPGINHSAIAQRLQLAEGQALYHLGVLHREEVLSRVDTPGRRHYFLRGAYAPALMRAMAELRLPASRRLFDTVRRLGGASMTTLAHELAVSRTRVSKVARRLEAAGLVRREPSGREVRVVASAPPEIMGVPTFREFGLPPRPTRAAIMTLGRSRRA